MAEESELVGGISVSLGASHEHLAGDIAAANAIVEEQWSNKVFTAKLRVESASGAGQAGPAAVPGAAQAGPIVVQARAVEEAGTQTVQARSALAIPVQQTTPGMTESEKLVEGLGGVEDATSGVAKSVQELAELQGRGTEAPTPAVVAQQRVERVQAAAEEIRPGTGTDVEAARTAALLSTHLENLNANIIGLGGRLAEEPIPHSYNVTARGAYNAPGYRYDISSPTGSGRPPVHVASSEETYRTADEATAAGGVYAQAMSQKVRQDLGMPTTRPVVQPVQPVVPTSMARPEPVVQAPTSLTQTEVEAAAVDTTALKASVAEVTTSLTALATALAASTERLAVAAAPIARAGLPATAPSMQMRDVEEEQAAAARSRRATQHEAVVAATAVQDRGIPDTSQEFLEERYTRPLAAQAAVEAVPVPRPATAVVRQAVDTVEIAAQGVSMPAAQVEAQAASIEAPRAAVTTERPESVVTTSVQPIAAGGGGRPPRRPTAVAAPADEPEEEGGLTGMTRRAAFGMREEERAGARIQGARSRAGRIAYNESEKQRRTEFNATVRHYDSLATLAERYFDEQANRLGGMEPSIEKAESQERLGNLTYEAQRENAGAPPPSATFAPHRTPAQIAALRAASADAAAPLVRPMSLLERIERSGGGAPPPPRPAALREEEARRADVAASAPRTTPRPGLTSVAPGPPPVDEVERARRRALTELENTPNGRGAGRPNFRQNEEENERQLRERVAGSEASRLGQARTARTAAAGLGGFGLFGGPTRQVIEAQAEQAAANREVARTQAVLNKPETIRNANSFRKASEEATVALTRQAKATEALEGLATKGTALRSLAAVTVAGAAFGLAMQGVSVAIQTVEKALGPTVERLTGFNVTTSAYTDQLSEATRAASGNAQAVTALKLAASGLSSTTAATIQPLIQQRAEIEAGNKAITEQIEAFHVAENLRKQGAGAGITSGTGGPLGNGFLGIPGVDEQIGNLLNQLGTATQRPRGGGNVVQPTQQALVENQAAFGRGLEFINEQMEKGGDTATKFAQDLSKLDPRIEQTAQAFNDIGSDNIAEQIRRFGLFSEAIAGISDPIERATAALKASQAINIAGQLPAPELLQQQFNRQNPALINQAERQQQFAANVQLPAQQALQNLAAPLKPVGTGFAPANAEEQRRVADTQKESIQLQDQLNKRYEQGVEILENTYKVPPQLLNQIKAVGQQIAGIQASISNEQAAYQTAQYNFQLGIAKRALSDIGGLTGKNFGAGQSYLGQLEKENLALSRQGQQLQFNLSQRSINFQRAVAGFTAPGLTPEERAARIEQANIEADIAQKQLDIGKGIFQNQVEIVDIQNLRQGADLVKQIALLEQGRAVTIDVQVKTEKIERFIAIQQQQVAEAGTYIAEVESLVQAAFSQIQQLEVAAGSAVAGIANKVLKQFGLTLNGINSELEEFTERLTPRGGGGFGSIEGGTGRRPTGTSPGADRSLRGAAGLSGRTQGKTSITVGEAGTEEVAVLSNPRAYLGGGGGGQSVSVVFTGEITVRSEDDLRKMEQTVESAIIRALGRGSSLQGLRLS